MHLTTAHLPKLIRSFEDSIQNGKDWLAFDSEIQLLSVYDLHYFDSADKAADFQLFNHLEDKEVTLLPVDALLGYVQHTASEQLKEGKSFNHIEIDDERVLGYYSDMKFNKTIAELEELLDQHDWKNAVYQPVQLPAEGTVLRDILQLIHQSFTVEQLSRFAVNGERAANLVQEMVTRHWTDTPMEKFIPDVLSGKILQQSFNHEHKTITMTQKNMEFLQNQLKTAGFSETLFPELEKNLLEGKESFQLPDNQAFGKDQMSSLLHFARSKEEGSDMYFFNKYDATLKSQTINASHSFFINNKGQSIDLKEACNLLNGRSVFKEVTPKEGDRYKAWLKLDFGGERDEHGNLKMNYFNQNYGFDLKEAISRLELKEMGNPDKMEALFKSLQRGDLTDATLIKGGKEIPVQITTDPKFKTLKMYDGDGSKLFVPGAKQDSRYGKAPVDEKKAAEGTDLKAGEKLVNGTEVKPTADATVANKKKDLLPKKVRENSLMPKNRVRQGKGQGIA
ncbi:MAG: hypothetical protein V4539_16190 [Bacteroidota bacterium]